MQHSLSEIYNLSSFCSLRTVVTDIYFLVFSLCEAIFYLFLADLEKKKTLAFKVLSNIFLLNTEMESFNEYCSVH